MKDHISEQISKVLAGEATAEERDDLRRHLLENEEESLLFNRLKEYWDADVSLGGKQEYAGLENAVMAKLGGSGVPRKETLSGKIYRWSASAAAVAILISSCFFVYRNVVDPASYTTYAAQSAPADYILTDGTKVKLNTNSSLTVKSNYGRRARKVRLDGEGYFMVARDASKKFIVDAAGTKTSVLGTSFNLKVEDGVVTNTLVEGSVRFTAGACDVLLTPGCEVRYDTESGLHESYETDTQFNTAWVSGRFTYDSISFGELISKLEEIYNLKITVTDDKISSRKVYASFLCGEPVEKILAAMETELGFNFCFVGQGEIVISAKGVK